MNEMPVRANVDNGNEMRGANMEIKRRREFRLREVDNKEGL